MSLHFIVRFEPPPGKESAFLQELLRRIEPSQAEPGCIALHVFESIREPKYFAIHSEWIDEAAFDTHAGLPDTVRFLDAAKQLLTHAVEGLRTREIGGGGGA